MKDKKRFVLRVLRHEQLCHESKLSQLNMTRELNQGKHGDNYDDILKRQIQGEEEFVKEYTECLKWIENINEEETTP